MRAGKSDILTEMSRPAYSYPLPCLGWNDLPRNSHPITELNADRARRTPGQKRIITDRST